MARWGSPSAVATTRKFRSTSSSEEPKGRSIALMCNRGAISLVARPPPPMVRMIVRAHCQNVFEAAAIACIGTRSRPQRRFLRVLRKVADARDLAGPGEKQQIFVCAQIQRGNPRKRR